MSVRIVGPSDPRVSDVRAWAKFVFESQTEAAIDGMLTASADGVLLTVNRSCREMWQLGEDLAQPGIAMSKLTDHIARLLADPAVYTQASARLLGEQSFAVNEQLSLRDGREIRWITRAIVDRTGEFRASASYYSDITRLVSAERDALANEARAQAVVEAAGDAIISLDDDFHVLAFNRSAGRIFGWQRDDLLWRRFDEVAVKRENQERFLAWLRDGSVRGSVATDRAEFPLVRLGGQSFQAECAVARPDGSIWVPITLFARDVSVEKRLEAELRQAQKLESVGRLASGIAHEINTPMQFVGDSLHFVREAVTDLLGAFEQWRALKELIATIPQAVAILEEAEQKADFEFLVEHLPKAIDSAAEGLDRVSNLVRGMKEFAHPGVTTKSPANLNKALDMTLTIARSEYSSVADVETDYGELPQIMCIASEINQVFLNILVNAAHAVSDVFAATHERGKIGVRTWHDGRSAFVSIRDTGAGIPEAVRDRIFDPFFTTKDVGRGTGQGLAIGRSVVVDKHGGELTFETKLGYGTTFTIRLPILPRAVDG
jgi:PAS domain S-box-containing protein